MDADIPIKIINDTGSTDFSVVVFTKNFGDNSPVSESYYAAWQVLHVNTSVAFEYPASTSVGATYGDEYQTVIIGPFGAGLGSTWEIFYEDRECIPNLVEGLYIILCKLRKLLARK